VSLVTYVVAVGLPTSSAPSSASLAVSDVDHANTFLLVNHFVFSAVLWLTAAALAASTGRLLDELIQREGVRSALRQPSLRARSPSALSPAVSQRTSSNAAASSSDSASAESTTRW